MSTNPSSSSASSKMAGKGFSRPSDKISDQKTPPPMKQTRNTGEVPSGTEYLRSDLARRGNEDIKGA